MPLFKYAGIRPVEFLGNFYMSNTADMEVAVMDCDSSVTVEIKHDDKLNEAEGAYVQAAILYTSISGQRRIRVLNAAFNCCSQMADLYRSCELDTLINVFARQGTFLNNFLLNMKYWVQLLWILFIIQGV